MGKTVKLSRGNPLVRQRLNSGFTLVELMAVLAIILCISSGAIAFFARTIAGYQLQQTAEQMAWEIRGQCLEAQVYGAGRQVEFFLFGNRYKIMQPKGRNVYLEPGIEFDYISIPSTGNRILLSFAVDGQADKGGTIALKNKYGQKRYVVLSPIVGRVRITDVDPGD